jgi:predicted nucleic acid-binding protein
MARRQGGSRAPAREEGVVELHASPFILGEVGRVLRDKFGWEEERAGRSVAKVGRVTGNIHEPPESVAVIEDNPTDNRILECTLAADAEFVVTGDKKHLLPLGSFRGVLIVGVADSLASFSTD